VGRYAWVCDNLPNNFRTRDPTNKRARSSLLITLSVCVPLPGSFPPLGPPAILLLVTTVGMLHARVHIKPEELSRWPMVFPTNHSFTGVYTRDTTGFSIDSRTMDLRRRGISPANHGSAPIEPCQYGPVLSRANFLHRIPSGVYECLHSTSSMSCLPLA
jgi:hypothetical protein